MKFPIVSRVTGAVVKLLGGTMSPVYGRGGGWFWPTIGEPYSGAWQNNDEVTCETVMESPALFSCITLIASDIAKLRQRLVALQKWGGWTPAESPSFSPVLKKPNRYQNHIQFKEHWMISKLTRGNTFVLKERDGRGVVVALYILDPQRVQVLVAPDSSIYYKLSPDDLTGVIGPDVVVPASEIIHDRFNCIWHPLIGVSPIYAAGMAAMQGIKISRHWTKFFGNNAQPGGILAAPGPISPENAKAIKDTWNNNYTGINSGKVAVIGDGMKYEALSPTALDSQVIQQLGWGAETIAGVFHVPAYKINVGQIPSNNNVEALDSQYYTQCLQVLIESYEKCMDDGLGIGETAGAIEGRILGVDLDLNGLLRMDTAAKVKAAADALKAGFMAPNEARAQFDLPPVDGGESPYLQQQNFSLEALDERDRNSPLSAPPPAPTPAPAEPVPPTQEEDDESAKALATMSEVLGALQKQLTERAAAEDAARTQHAETLRTLVADVQATQEKQAQEFCRLEAERLVVKQQTEAAELASELIARFAQVEHVA